MTRPDAGIQWEDAASDPRPLATVRRAVPRARGTADRAIFRPRRPGPFAGARASRAVQRAPGAPPEAPGGGSRHAFRLRGRFRDDAVRLRRAASEASGDLPDGTPAGEDGGGDPRGGAGDVRLGGGGFRGDLRDARLPPCPRAHAFRPRGGLCGGRGACVDGTGGEGPGRRPKGGAVGGVAAAARLRGPEGPGDGGGDATPDLPGGGGGVRAARLPVPRDLVRLLRLHPASVDAGRTASLFRPAGRGLLSRALRRRRESSSFVPVRRQDVGSAARRLRGKRGVPGRRPLRRDRVRAGADLLPRAAPGSSTRPVPGPLRSPRGRGDAPRRPPGPVLAGRRSPRLRRPRREEGDP